MIMIYYAFVYGLLTIVGGLIGYFKAGSQASLISGLISGLIIIISAWALMKGKTVGYFGVLAVAACLIYIFLPKFMQTHKMMPAGLMLILSIISVVGFILERSQLLGAAS